MTCFFNECHSNVLFFIFTVKKLVFLFPGRLFSFIRQCFVSVEQIKEIRFLTHRHINVKCINELGNTMGS